MVTRNKQQNLPCIRCGYTFKEPQYSGIARRLLHTNEPPQSVYNNDEAAFLRGEVKRGHDMLASVDKDIATLQVSLGRLEEKRKLVQKFIDDHAVVLSPFRRTRLPPEVLTEIFHFAEPVVYANVKRGLWQFGRVCSYWRSVLRSSPSLWTTIDVQWGRTPIIEEMLSRSGNLLLDVTLGANRTTTAEVGSSVIRTVITASLRWHRIAFFVRYIPDPALQLLSQLKDRVPMLMELEYYGLTFPEWQGAPLLRKLNVYLSHPLSLSLDLPWSNIRDCDVRPLTLNEEHQLLRQCPNLETYTMVSRTHWQSDPVPSDMLCLSELHTLILRDDITSSIDFLILPHLDHVSVHDINYTQRRISSLHNLLSRSRCFPRKLSIYSYDDIAAQLVSLLPFQNLTTLDVTCPSNFSTLFPVLTIRPGSSSVLLPQLEKLYLCLHHHLSPTVENMGLLTEMVRSRWHPHENAGIRNRLAFFEFNAYKHPSLLGALAPLVVFRDEGLELDVDEFFLRRTAAR